MKKYWKTEIEKARAEAIAEHKLLVLEHDAGADADLVSAMTKEEFFAANKEYHKRGPAAGWITISRDYTQEEPTPADDQQEASMKKPLLAPIKRHNDVIAALNNSELPVPEGKMFRAMTIWHKLACEGSDITGLARDNGIDAKCNMQTGEITVYGMIGATDNAECVCPVCDGKIEYSGGTVQTCGGGMHPWTYPSCGATGAEGFHEVFDGRHYGVRDKNGSPVPGREA